jgi:hypothetical protein
MRAKGMSHYKVVKCNVQGADNVVHGLEAVGFPSSAIETHRDPISLNGYGSQTGMANIVVRKDALRKYQRSSGYGDMGFLEQEDGTYSVTIDSYDKRWWNAAQPQFLQAVAESRSRELAESHGYIVETVETEEEGVIRLVAERSY